MTDLEETDLDELEAKLARDRERRLRRVRAWAEYVRTTPTRSGASRWTAW